LPDPIMPGACDHAANGCEKPMKFDAEFYRRYYRDPRTRIATRQDQERLADFVCAYTAYLGFRVRRVLDAGCGLGFMQASVRRFFPRARYVGLEVSDFLARRHGWVHSQLEDYHPRAPFDLVICHDVLQYLKDGSAARAVANLGRLSRGVLYCSALTREDWRSTADRARSDGGVHLRPAAWYFSRLKRNFRPFGPAVWVRRGYSPVLWEMERQPGGRDGKRG
jgi:SAM-dependent methyltransferase